MKILIADDEAPARARLTGLIQALGEHHVVGEAAMGRQALELCDREHPDVVLMDIRMPGMDGLEAATRLALLDKPPAVIFVTAYGDHALEAFGAEAIDYLLKPVRRERLAEALKKARRINRAQLQTLNDLEKIENPGREQILCRRRGKLELIPLEDVRYFQADQKYVTVSHLEGEDLIEDSLKRLEQEFGDRFVRVHRNALVARSYLAGMAKDAEGHFFVTLRDCDDRLEVSRRHTSSVRRLLHRLGAD